MTRVVYATVIDASRKFTRVEALLVERGVVTAEALVAAKDRQRGAKRPLVDVLAEQGSVDEGLMATVLAEAAGVPLAPPGDLKPEADVQKLVPPELARIGILPLRIEGGALIVAATDPMQVLAFDEIAQRTGMRVRVVVAKASAVREAMGRTRKSDESLHELLKNAAADDGKLQIEAPRDAHGEVAVDATEDDGRIVRLVNLLLSDAIRERASDVHIEPEKETTRIRFRVDGELREVSTVAAALHPLIASRVKIVAGLSIIENRRPQDGRVKVTCDGKPYDLRVSTLPTYFGEKIVMRVLDPSAATFDLDACGIASDTIATWRSLLRRPNGMLLLTGPTGSGKTSTLFASLLELRDPSLNITTVEDPVEYQFPGIVHVPVRADIGMTFAVALRSILRQDPDVVLLGEIRDRETAQIAVQAAMTGHLVLSTLHTNDAVAAIPRLLDLGIEPALLAASLLGVMAQRLARTVCTSCAQDCTYSSADLEPLGWTGEGTAVAKGLGKGCNRCGGSGYKGRTALAELVTMTPDLARLVATSAPRHELREQAQRDGTRTLVLSGLDRALAGATTPAEILCVAASDLAGQPQPRSRAVRKEARAGAAAESGPCVLVCDDEPTARRLAALALRQDFPRVEQAEDGRQALDKFASAKPDLVIVDQHMPGMTGVEVIRELRSHLAGLAVPIIMLTAGDDESVEVASLDAGADDYLRKPVSAQRLRARAAALLANRRRAAESSDRAPGAEGRRS